MWQSCDPSKGSKGRLFLPLPAARAPSLAWLVCLHRSSPCLCPHVAFSHVAFSGSVSPFCLPLLRTPVIAFRTHLGNWGSLPHLRIFNIILFQIGSQSQLLGIGPWYLWGCRLPHCTHLDLGVMRSHMRRSQGYHASGPRILPSCPPVTWGLSRLPSSVTQGLSPATLWAGQVHSLSLTCLVLKRLTVLGTLASILLLSF